MGMTTEGQANGFDPRGSGGRGQSKMNRPGGSGLKLDFAGGGRKLQDAGTSDAGSDASGMSDTDSMSQEFKDLMSRSQSSGMLRFSHDTIFPYCTEDLVEIELIGQGAFGTVTKERHKQTNKLVAVKRIRSTMDKKEEKRLLRELDAIMKCDSCPTIVQFYGATFKEGDCWICMELMDTSLDRLYKAVFNKLNERLPEPIIGKIAACTVDALTFLKDRLSIIHRDVKPSNILLDRRGFIKLCDFGIAGQLVDSIAKTRDAGCRPYMAPERIDPHRSGLHDVRSDVWSLGITLVEISRGRFPYSEWSSVFDQLQEVVHGDPPALTRDEPFSTELILFVNYCLIKDETQRPKYKQLQDTPFLRKYAAEAVDVASFVSRVLDTAPPDSADIKVNPAIMADLQGLNL